MLHLFVEAVSIIVVLALIVIAAKHLAPHKGPKITLHEKTEQDTNED